MINRLQLLRNVGQFESVSTKLGLAKLSLIYAENGRGKTTRSAILRSLATGEPLPIVDRHRLGAAHPPEVVIVCSGGPPARFQNGAWSRTCSDLVVFDDVFVDNNVCSGLEVAAGHRQNLHELIIGEQGVTLARRVGDLAEEIRIRNGELRAKTTALQAVDKQGFSIDDFCAFSSQDNIDEAITASEKRVASISQAEAVRTTTGFASLTVPALDVEGIKNLLATTIADIDAVALARVKAHFKTLGKGSEAWISTGVEYATALATNGREQCPFCTEPLSSSAMFTAYRAHFAAAYKKLGGEIAGMLSEVENALKGDALAGFERQLQTAKARQTFWAAFCSVPQIAVDSTELAGAWQSIREALLTVLRAKQADPLQAVSLDAQAESISWFADVTSKVKALTRHSRGLTRTSNGSRKLPGAAISWRLKMN